MKPVRFSKHAEIKFEMVNSVGFSLDRQTVQFVVNNPRSVEEGREGLKIAQDLLDETHVLRIVYAERGDEIVIVTLYPGRRRHYEI